MLAVELAVALGGSVQFSLARSVGRPVVYKLGETVGLSAERLDGAVAALQQRGAWDVFLGLNIPGARAGIIAAAGLAALQYRIFAPAMVGGGTVYYGWHIGLGYLTGPAASALLEGLRIPLWPVVAGVAGLGLAGWLVLRARRGWRGMATTAGDHLRSWTEAACPACLIASAMIRDR